MLVLMRERESQPASLVGSVTLFLCFFCWSSTKHLVTEWFIVEKLWGGKKKKEKLWGRLLINVKIFPGT